MSARARVAITGVGVVSPIGCSAAELTESLRLGRCGIAALPDRDPESYHSNVAALARDFAPHADPSVPDGARLDRASLMALDAFRQAERMAGIDFGNAERAAALVMGTTLGGMCSGLEFYGERVRHGRFRARTLDDFPPHAANDRLMAAGPIDGASVVLSSACAASTHAIGTAAALIRTGRADVVVAGGVDTFDDLTFCGFGVLGLLSKDVARPFDRRRTGLVLGEGAGVVVLESLEHARRRGATALGEVLGFGQTSDAFHMTSPESDGQGAVRAMREALDDAGLEPRDIGHVNAHGTATPKNDEVELAALAEVLGAEGLARTPLNSTKSMIGHTLGAAGALELVATLLSLNAGFVHPTVNVAEIDGDVPPDVVIGTARETEVRHAMSNSFGFGGNNGTLVLATARTLEAR